MAATRIVRELMAAGLIEEFEESKKGKGSKRNVGRPRTGLRIVSQGLFAAGITVSAYHSEVSICDASGNLHAHRRLENLPFESVSDAARFYATALGELIDSSQIDVDRIVGVGVALSARTAPDRREIVTSEYFGWDNDGGAFCREVQNIIDLPVEIENIANALAIAEMRYGGARDVRDFTLIHAATFVGASVVSENRIVRGASGVSGLIGHFRADEQPLSCVCGRHDCLNLNATGFALLSKLGKLDHRAFDRSKLSFYAASLLKSLDDEEASSLVATIGRKLAPALDSIAKLLGPRMIILSGHLGANDSYFNGAKAALEGRFEYGPEAPFTLVQGTISSVRSAALLALHAFCYSDRLDFERFARIAKRRDESLYG